MSETAETFYEAFQRLDHEAMASCYAPQAVFTDPVFDLRGQDIGAMWQMLCLSSKDLAIEFQVVDSQPSKATIDWEAWYTFPPTGRRVHNKVQAQMTFADGLITEHRDYFDFYRWSRQAFGGVGFLLGWAPPFRSRVASSAMRGLNRQT